MLKKTKNAHESVQKNSFQIPKEHPCSRCVNAILVKQLVEAEVEKVSAEKEAELLKINTQMNRTKKKDRTIGLLTGFVAAVLIGVGEEIIKDGGSWVWSTLTGKEDDKVEQPVTPPKQSDLHPITIPQDPVSFTPSWDTKTPETAAPQPLYLFTDKTGTDLFKLQRKNTREQTLE